MPKPDLPAAVLTPVREIQPNPKNPRIVRDHRYKQLLTSLRQFPEMLALRPIVVNAEKIVLAGNARLKAARELGFETIPVIVAHLTPEQEQEFVIKDNVHAGDFLWTSFFENHDEWDVHLLGEWGLDVPFMPTVNPTTAHREVTEEQVTATKARLDAKFGEARGLQEVTCCHCGEVFYLDA